MVRQVSQEMILSDIDDGRPAAASVPLVVSRKVTLSDHASDTHPSVESTISNRE